MNPLPNNRERLYWLGAVTVLIAGWMAWGVYLSHHPHTAYSILDRHPR